MRRQWLADGLLTAVLLLGGLCASAGLSGPPGPVDILESPRPFGPLGALLLAAATLPLVARRRAPMAVLAAHLVAAIPYHALEFQHEVVVPATIVALYTAARYGNRRRTLLIIAGVVTFGILGILTSRRGGENVALEAFGAIGWIVLACVAGEAVRLQRAYVAEALDRAERAERSRDEEARRQVAEERLRIARDLHDLLAHTITVIQVQAGVASHLVSEGQSDRETLTAALDTIADACSDARAELTATVGVLRAPTDEPRGPLPSLAQLPNLAEPAEVAGVTVEFTITGAVRPLPPTVELVGYRIVQEALTNIAKHAKASRAEVALDYRADRLVVRVADDGPDAAAVDRKAHGRGFGVRGMIERAEAVGGRVEIASGATGFTVRAHLPVTGAA
ncbi:sensor histidine kinase [Nocardia huaxiensis]|uniref:sensor histidine kinase n=1 Tax=Nocardia huaxiensis TaxID=2755382 RepID=UPI001E580488|nr:sensor histidine kinase [Nocardia huaxiensis]UFS98781.1 sensor histidine kinase [Nocardia huaxiensis]